MTTALTLTVNVTLPLPPGPTDPIVQVTVPLGDEQLEPPEHDT